MFSGCVKSFLAWLKHREGKLKGIADSPNVLKVVWNQKL